MSDSVPAELHQLTFTCHENCRRRSHLVRHGKKTRPDPDLISSIHPCVAILMPLWWSAHYQFPRSPQPSRYGLGRSPGDQNQFERSHPNAG